MSNFPFSERRIGKDRLVRRFSADTSQDELVWHRDRHSRIVQVLEGKGWSLQLDNKLPVPLAAGMSHRIPAQSWHRVMRSEGASDLTVLIKEQVYTAPDETWLTWSGDEDPRPTPPEKEFVDSADQPAGFIVVRDSLDNTVVAHAPITRTDGPDRPFLVRTTDTRWHIPFWMVRLIYPQVEDAFNAVDSKEDWRGMGPGDSGDVGEFKWQWVEQEPTETQLAEGKKKSKRLPGKSDYYVGKRKSLRTKSNRQMKQEIEKCAREPRPKSCYDEWTADKTYKKKSAKNESASSEVIERVLDEALEDVLNEIDELELNEGKLSKKTRETLRKKAENANMPLGALTGVYRKGLAAWLTGHRQGVPQHAWAMGRVNSFIRGGKARSVDASQWKSVQKHRNRRKPKKKD